MVILNANGMDLEVWRSAATTMSPDRVAKLMPDLWELGRDAFPRVAESVVDEDLVHHYLAPTFGAYQFVDGQVRALTAAESFDLASGRTLYFSNSSIHSSLRGRGLYRQMLLLRIAIGRVTGCEWWATRTMSPIVAHSFLTYGCYPWNGDEEASAVAVEVAQHLHQEFEVLGQKGGGLDRATGVLRRVYPTNLYTTIPDVESQLVQDHFQRHVDRETGDALLLVGRLESIVEALAPRCVEHFGVDFDTLCEQINGM